MKARLVPIYFSGGMDADFQRQLTRLAELLEEVAQLLEPIPLGASLPDADAAIFPQLLGDAYTQVEALKQLKLPLLVITSEFATVSMWDWEIISFLKTEGLNPLAPYSQDLAHTICRSLALKRDLQETRFLLFQDNPGEGFQADIFKRFYWWTQRCTQALQHKFGVSIQRRSFEALGQTARQIPDHRAEAVREQRQISSRGVSQHALNSAVKLYLAIEQELAKDTTIKGVGINCLNESHFAETTPCLAWSLLFEEQGVLWACEADTVSLMTQYLLYHTLQAPAMMSNLYPQLVGESALKHEKIDRFPEVPDPENHLLVAHCGYLGLLPPCWSTDWYLRPKVLSIVDENATAIDARLPEGVVTLVKLDHTFSKLMTIKGELVKYVQFPGSDCRNGAVVKIEDGPRLMESFYSHHMILVTGHRQAQLTQLAKVFELELEPF